MYVWGVVELELESHPDHNMEHDPRTLRCTKGTSIKALLELVYQFQIDDT